MPKQKPSVHFDRSLKFPQKLWEAVNDPDDLIQWNEDGTGVVVNADYFTSQVMTRYPGEPRLQAP